MRIISLIGLLLLGSVVHGQVAEESILKKTIPSIELCKGSRSEVLASLAETYKIPIGDEVSSPSTTETSSFADHCHLKSATVQEILDTLLKGRPDYHWQVADNVINISSFSTPEPLLDAVIPKFDSQGPNGLRD